MKVDYSVEPRGAASVLSIKPNEQNS